MELKKILAQWISFCDRNLVRNKFDGQIRWQQHVYNEMNDTISAYDPSGALSVVHARYEYRNFLSTTRVSLMSLAENPDQYQEFTEMWKLFQSDDVDSVEHDFLNKIIPILGKIRGAKQVNQEENAAEESALFGAAIPVIESIEKCNVDLFARGEPIQPELPFNTYIHIFNTLAECLLALEQAEDGIYLCYIETNTPKEGYFSIFFKSSGTILSINDREDEAYPGAHRRDSMWNRTKSDENSIFPYAFIQAYLRTGNKKASNDHITDDDSLALSKLNPERRATLALALYLSTSRFAGQPLSGMKIKYVDSLLPVNLPHAPNWIQKEAKSGKSGIIALHEAFDYKFTSEDVLSGTVAARFNNERAFPTGENLFVKMYGQGFQMDPSLLLAAEPAAHVREGGQAPEGGNVEFVGEEDRLSMVAYRNARAQLADYLRDRMLEKYIESGKNEAVGKWVEEALKRHKAHMFSLCAERYRQWEENPWAYDSPLNFISVDDKLDAEYTRSTFPFNELKDAPGSRTDGKPLCTFTGSVASVVFEIRPRNWKELQLTFDGEALPDILTGWSSVGQNFNEKNAIDPVLSVGSPFDLRELETNPRLWAETSKNHYFINEQNSKEWEKRKAAGLLLERSPHFPSLYLIAFSKRGLKKLLSEY